MKITFFALWLGLLSVFAQAQSDHAENSPDNIAAQRALISAERSRLNAGYLTEDAACYKKFAVNNCLGEVNARRREAMANLRRQEVLLNDEERRRKGAEQIRKTEEKSSPEKLQGDVERSASATKDYQRRLDQGKDKQQERSELQSNEKNERDAYAAKMLNNQKKSQMRSQRQAEATEKAKKFSERQKEAQERLTRHEADQLKRSNPSAKPLPLPE